jgi:hypothetical protein
VRIKKRRKGVEERREKEERIERGERRREKGLEEMSLTWVS